MEVKPLKKLKLYGFNNLTKSLSFNMYDICYAKAPEHHKAYIQYVDEEYNSERLTKILSEVAEIIGAKILNISKFDFDPQGSSVTMLISEGEEHSEQTPLESIVTQLDKSHITVHTYPESSPDQGISSFRADIDVSTCGHISPLTALNHLIKSFAADIVIADYRVRGFTRDVSGKKFFIDHKINSIQNYIAGDIRQRYQMIDVNVYQENLFHTKMILKDFDLDNYLFASSQKDFTQQERNKINQRLRKEMNEIFYGRNVK